MYILISNLSLNEKSIAIVGIIIILSLVLVYKYFIPKDNTTKNSESKNKCFIPKDDIKKDGDFDVGAFFEGLYMLIIYSIFVVIFSTIMVLIIASIFNFTDTLELMIFTYALLASILLFTTIYTSLMVGAVAPFILGNISGIGLFLIILAKLFFSTITLGAIAIPIYVPASSFLGVMGYIFVDLYYNPSNVRKINGTEAFHEDDKRIKEYIARIFGAIVISLFVYLAAQPVKQDSAYYALFGFASGFYISPTLNFLRKKIYTLIDPDGLKEEDRKRLIKEIEKHPRKYSILSDSEISRNSDAAGVKSDELKNIIFEELRKTIKNEIIKDPEQYSILSESEIDDIIKKTKMDKDEFKAIISFIKEIGTRAAKGLMKKDFHTRKDFP